MVNSIGQEGIDLRKGHMIEVALDSLMEVHPRYTSDIDAGLGELVAKAFRKRAEELKKDD